MSVLRAVPLGAVCLLYAATLAAAPQSKPLPPRHATAISASAPLRSAVAEVWEKTPAVQAAQAELAAAQARTEAAAQSLYNPSLSVGAENADTRRRTIGLSMPLDVWGKGDARESQANAKLRASQAAYKLVRRDTAARWLVAWTSLALATEQTQLGQRRLGLMQRFDKLAALRLKVGDISSPERDIAALALAEARLQQAALIGNEAAAKASLRAISGKLPQALPPLPSKLPFAPMAITPVETSRLPELARARAEQASAEAGVTVAQRARRPDPVISLTGGEVRYGNVRDQVIGLNVSIPLPILNTGRAEVAVARAEADAAAADLRASRFAISARLAETQARYAALRQAASAYRNGRAADFEDRAALLEKLWRAGEISTSDYLVQLKQSLDTALSGLELESQTWQAWFDYLTAAGHLTDWVDGRAQDDAP